MCIYIYYKDIFRAGNSIYVRKIESKKDQVMVTETGGISDKKGHG